MRAETRATITSQDKIECKNDSRMPPNKHGANCPALIWSQVTVLRGDWLQWHPVGALLASGALLTASASLLEGFLSRVQQHFGHLTSTSSSSTGVSVVGLVAQSSGTLVACSMVTKAWGNTSRCKRVELVTGSCHTQNTSSLLLLSLSSISSLVQSLRLTELKMELFLSSTLQGGAS